MLKQQTFSVKTRFIASFRANIYRSAIRFATGMILARWLGPDDYGRMAFLLASFMAFRQIFDMATSSAFFTFLSQRPRSKRFVIYFWRWIGLQFLVSFLLVAFFLPEAILHTIWEGEYRSLIVLALIATFMQQYVWSTASQMAEAQRETIRVQRLNTLVVSIHLVVVVALWVGGKLLLPLIFIALIAEWSIAGWFAARMYRGVGKELLEQHANTSDTAVSVFKEFWVYCVPFIPYAWLSFAHDFGDRWMLQRWGGSSEQAYYAVAQQFAAVALLATTSILRIFWKEIAEAQHQGDDAKVKWLYLKISRGLYFFGALIAGGLLPWAGEILSLLLGEAYYAGVLTLMLMFFYPVHQSMGQIGLTMLYATEQTRVQVIIGLVFMATSIVVVYFMLAPTTMIVPGLGLASQGLAIKMVVMQLIQVNILAFFIARIFGWKFEWLYQLVGLGSAVAAGWLSKLLIVSILSGHTFILMAGSWIVYLIIMSMVVYIMPWVIGLTHDELRSYYFMAIRKK